MTIKDVAKRAGASLSTVSYVLNDNAEKFVSEELRRRVLQAAKELNYRPNQIARRLRGKTGKILAVLVPQFENVYFNRVVIGAQKVADERGYVLCIYSTYDDEERETDFIQNIVAQRVDGILLCPANNRTSAADLIREAGVPFVVIDREIAGADFDFVAIDNYQAAYAAAEYLIEGTPAPLQLGLMSMQWPPGGLSGRGGKTRSQPAGYCMGMRSRPAR